MGEPTVQADSRDGQGRFAKGHSGNPGGRIGIKLRADKELERLLIGSNPVGQQTIRILCDKLREWLVGDDVLLARFAADKLLERAMPVRQDVGITYPDGIPAESQPEADNTPDAIQATVNALSDLGFFEPPADGEPLH
jgi:hypothetical protein